MSTSFPVMNIAPPVFALFLFLVTLSVKLELYISTLSPVIQIVPPLEVLGSEGSPVLVPLLFTKLHPSIIPSLPSQYMAPPSSPATSLVNVESYILQSLPLIYIAPASSRAVQPSKVQVSIKVLLPMIYIAPP